jgi:hypothetical protein
LAGAKSAAGIPKPEREKGRMGTGWQLLEGVAALFVSVTLTYWIFVAPSRAKRERQRLARELQDPRHP